MKKELFLSEISEILLLDNVCNENDILDDFDEWDSLARMSVAAFYNKNFDSSITFDDLQNLKTVKDLLKLAGDNIDD